MSRCWLPQAVANNGSSTARVRVAAIRCPSTLLADDKPGSERIHVIFSQERLDDPTVSAALRSGDRSAAVWVDQWLLRKAVVQP